jgi:hypothetical protein
MISRLSEVVREDVVERPRGIPMLMEAQIRYDIAASEAISERITYDICFRPPFALERNRGAQAQINPNLIDD